MTSIQSNRQRVAVIGAGIMGASIAWRIAARGARVTLIDKNTPGSGASSHSFAWINAGLKHPVGYHNLNRRSMDMWDQFAAAIADDGDRASVGLRWGGKLSWEVDASGAERLISEVRQSQSWGYPSRLISASELSELEPSLEVGDVVAAEYSENEAQVEPQLVVDACLRRLAEMEAVVHAHTEVIGFAPDGDGRIAAVRTTSGDMECDAVVLAAGTDTTTLADMAGAHVPQAESPGVVIRTTPVAPLLQNVPVVYAPTAQRRPSGDTHSTVRRRQDADRRRQSGKPSRRRQPSARRRPAGTRLPLPARARRREGDTRASRLASNASRRLPHNGLHCGSAKPIHRPNAQRRNPSPRPQPASGNGDMRRRISGRGARALSAE